nr:nicotinate (nicotinamide) nucleotide adenylyltransferase [Shewanella jiangmenensis]
MQQNELHQNEPHQAEPKEIGPPVRHTLLLGGTFDPPHQGHIAPLLTLLRQWPFDDCWLMPNRIPPHKPGPHASNADRLAMLQSLCALHPALSVCELELERDEPSYTVATLTQLGELYPERRFYFVMGMDSFLNLPLWYKWQSLFSLCHILLCARPGYRLEPEHPMAKVLKERAYPAIALQENTNQKCTEQTSTEQTSTEQTSAAQNEDRQASNTAKLPDAPCGRIIVADIDELDVSSSAIREALMQGRAMPDEVPEAVGRIIRERGLYR